MHLQKLGARDMGRPATGVTKLRNIRVPDGLWNAAKEKAATENRTLTDVILAALHRYVSTPAKPSERPADPHSP